MPDKKPDFFLVGAPKCGTTAMYAYLRHHPQVFLPRRKEPNFFNTDMSAPGFIRDVSDYLSLFSEAREKSRIGEASPLYLYSKRAALEIKEFCGDASIIIMLRDPVEMMYSYHSQHLYNGKEDIKDFGEALEAEADRKRGLRIPRGQYAIEGLFYREIASYSQQVERYLNAFRPDNVHIILFDDFRRDTLETYGEVLRFLGLDDGFQPTFKTINPNKRVRSRRLANLAKKIKPLKTRPVNPLRKAPYKLLKALNIRYEARPPIDPGLRRRLRIEFKPEVERLSQLLGRDLSHWSVP